MPIGVRIYEGAVMNRLKHWLFRRRHGALVDALRRSNEMLAGGATAYHYEEVDYIRSVNYRLLREYDPRASTDRKVR